MTTRVEMELHAGMRNHSYMYNRDAANQHPMSAITGLNDKLAGMGSVVEMTAFTGAMNAATVDGPAVTVTSPTDRMSEAMWNELAVGKYIIGPEGVKIFRCTAKTETSFSAVCVSVANLRGEKGDKGDTGNTGPKGDAFKYSDFTADQLAALKGPKGDTGSTGPAGAKGDAYEITSADYEAIAEIVEDEYTEELASVKNDLRTQTRKVKALTDLLNGQELRFDTESITGASIDVASGCVADSVLKVSGKSVVVNQLCLNGDFSSGLNGYVLQNFSGTVADGVATFTSTSDSATHYIRNTLNGRKTVSGHKYYVKASIKSSIATRVNYRISASDNNFDINADSWVEKGLVCTGNGEYAESNIYIGSAANPYASSGVMQLKNFITIDLTQMFGSGNEPSLSECQKIFTADYYPYNTGTIVSSQTDSVKCRGKNLFDVDMSQYGTLQNDGAYLISSLLPLYETDFANLNGSSEIITAQVKIKLKAATNVRLDFLYTDGTHTQGTIASDTDTYVISSVTSNGKTIKRLRIDYSSSGAYLVKDFQLEKSSTATTYSPYSLRTITTSFPTLKSAGSVSDYIDLASARPSTNAGKSIVDVHRLVDTTTIKALVESGAGFGFAELYSYVLVRGRALTSNAFAAGYSNKINEIQVNTSNTGMPFKYASGAYASWSEFYEENKNAVIYYEKATPTTETLEIPTDLLSAINVEAGGQITFVDHNSTLAMPITTTNEWVVRNDEV